jgi:hypothetical protein
MKWIWSTWRSRELQCHTRQCFTTALPVSDSIQSSPAEQGSPTSLSASRISVHLLLESQSIKTLITSILHVSANYLMLQTGYIISYIWHVHKQLKKLHSTILYVVIKTRARCPTETTGHVTHGKFEDFPQNECWGVTKCKAIVFVQPALSLTCTH